MAGVHPFNLGGCFSASLGRGGRAIDHPRSVPPGTSRVGFTLATRSLVSCDGATDLTYFGSAQGCAWQWSSLHVIQLR